MKTCNFLEQHKHRIYEIRPTENTSCWLLLLLLFDFFSRFLVTFLLADHFPFFDLNADHVFR